MSEWNIDFLIAVLLLNELLWGSRGKANSDAWLAGFALALLNTPRVLMWEIQQREEGGSLFLCGTDMERPNETHQWDRLILSQSTKQPFGFRHSGCSQGENELQSRGILCNSPREVAAAALHHPGLCLSSSGSPGQSRIGCSSHTHRHHRRVFASLVPVCCLWKWPDGQSLCSHGGMSCWDRSALQSWNLHETVVRRDHLGKKGTSLGKGHTWERRELDLCFFFFKASSQASWKVKRSPCSEIFITKHLPETIEIAISYI